MQKCDFYLSQHAKMWFTLKQNLNKHKQTVHNIDSKLAPTKKCPLSDPAFSTAGTLDKHLVDYHEIELGVTVDFDSITGHYFSLKIWFNFYVTFKEKSALYLRICSLSANFNKIFICKWN